MQNLRPYQVIFKGDENKKGFIGPCLFYMRQDIFTKDQIEELVNCLNVAFDAGIKHNQDTVKKVLNI